MATRDVMPWVNRGSHLRRSARFGDLGNLVNSLHNQIERAFNDVWGGLESPQFGGNQVHAGACDIRETDEGLEVCIDLPGFEDKDLEINIADDTLSIRAETSQDSEEDRKGYIYSERRRGRVYRAIPLPPGTDINKVTAAFANGVLTIKVPRAEKEKTPSRRIEITSAAKSPGNGSGNASPTSKDASLKDDQSVTTPGP